MNLTEPHCGTDLGLIKAKAVPNGDGSYSITAPKIFISAGEQDITENIVHLVLARIEARPEGVKGISLFVVPATTSTPDGSVGERNGVLLRLDRAQDGHPRQRHLRHELRRRQRLARGRGEPRPQRHVRDDERGRLGVAIQGLAQSEVAYQNAVAYAKDRLQGRSLSGAKHPEKAADPIIVHPDVRRNLMSSRPSTRPLRRSCSGPR
jgi:alkylation response protein AidB-like acyl-CoA dehydrogenase